MLPTTLKPKRIMIFGRPGSGKSTFGYKLSLSSQLPVHHIDKYFFISHWQKRNSEEFLNIHQDFVDQDSWIIDGNSTRSLAIRWCRADLVLYFNFPRWLCYFRVVKRIFFKNKKIDDRAEGCSERISYELCHYMWDYEKRIASTIAIQRQQFPYIPFIELTHNNDVYALYNELNCIFNNE